jgi:glycosyltransferase involved in cell wall biosynthesis
MKNAERSVKDLFASLEPFLRDGDEVVVVDTGSTDKTVRKCRKHGARVIERPDLNKEEMIDLAREWCPVETQQLLLKDKQLQGGWVSSFAEARQISFDAAKNDLCMWLDSDDTLEGGAELREGIDHYFGQENPISTMFIRYDYAHDKEDGKCTTELYRERIVNRSEWSWKGSCHEVLIPNGGLEAVQDRFVHCRVPEVFFYHVPKHKKAPGVADLRNYVILRKEIEELPDGEVVDPRTFYYMGNACRGLFRWGEAVDYYKLMLDSSGSMEDRQNAALNAGHCMFAMGRYWAMLRWGQKCLQIDPDDPRGYFMIARAYYHMRNWKQCIHWTAIGRSHEKAESLHSLDPNSLDFYPAYFCLESHRELGDIEGVKNEAERLLRLRPDLELVQEHVQGLKQWAQEESVRNAVMLTAKCAKNQQDAQQITQLIRNPAILEDLGIGEIEQEIHSNEMGEVVFLCGKTDEAWGPQSVKTGIGGSERMIIELAPRLASRGHAVSVYANIPHDQRGLVDGVSWRHHTSFNPKIKRKNLVAWRAPETLKVPVAAKRRYVWLHDAIDARRFTPELIALATKVMPLSQWHRDMYKNVPDNKIYLSRNGVDAELIRQLVKDNAKKRDPKRIVYSSSPDRGLVQALNSFTIAQQQDPELTLEICYGFTPFWYSAASRNQYGYVVTQKKQRHLFEFSEEVFAAIDATPNCIWHGRLPCHAVSEIMSQSGLWLYPTPFTEISCMSAMEAQAAGLAVVASKVAALEETIDWSSELTYHAPDSQDPRITADQILEAAQIAADDKRRSELSESALKRFDLDALADSWHRDLFV